MFNRVYEYADPHVKAGLELGPTTRSGIYVKKPECPALPSALSREGMNGYVVLGADQRRPLEISPQV